MRALVTGGAGFIGQHLVRRLLALGHPVTVLDDYSTGTGASLDPATMTGLRVVRGDFCDAAAADGGLLGCDVLFHLAAMVSVPESVAFPERCRAVNVEGSRRLFARAAESRVRRIVFASSCAVYGPGADGPIPESWPPRPLSPYAESKLAGERILFEELRERVSAVALRFFNVYGPGQRADSAYAAAIPRFVRTAHAGEPPVLYGDGSQTRDFVFVEDVARALVRAANAPEAAAGRAYNIASGRAISLNQVLGLLQTMPGSRLGDARHEPARPGDIRHSLADCTAAESALGFAAETEFAVGLRALWDGASS